MRKKKIIGVMLLSAVMTVSPMQAYATSLFSDGTESNTVTVSGSTSNSLKSTG
jgi:hypothetical protein